MHWQVHWDDIMSAELVNCILWIGRMHQVDSIFCVFLWSRWWGFMSLYCFLCISSNGWEQSIWNSSVNKCRKQNFRNMCMYLHIYVFIFCWINCMLFWLTRKVLNFWKFTGYCSLKPLWSGMGEVVPARTSPTLHPPSPPTVHQLSRLAL